MSDEKYPAKSSKAEIADFMRKVAATPVTVRPGETGASLIFAMDATASREPTWDQASHIQARMFEDATALGGLNIQLAWFRGYGEFQASPWCTNAAELLPQMTAVTCRAGTTQIGKVLRHAVEEAHQRRISALVYVGDCMEEDVDRLCATAGELAILGVPVFLFHEGHDPVAAIAFQEIANTTRGAYCPFDAGSPGQLRDLLSAVAVYAAGGRRALDALVRRKGGMALRLAQQIKR